MMTIRSISTSATRRLAAAASTALAVSMALMLSGCASESVNGNGNTATGVGAAIVEIPVDERDDQIVFAGTDETGQAVSSLSYEGRVLVVNFWYAGCPPCRAEAGFLNEVAAQLDPKQGAFLGVNVRDSAETATSFHEEFGVPYHSIIDTPAALVQLAFAGSIPQSAVPVTVVLDRQGRMAARILGGIPQASILQTIVDDVIAEG